MLRVSRNRMYPGGAGLGAGTEVTAEVGTANTNQIVVVWVGSYTWLGGLLVWNALPPYCPIAWKIPPLSVVSWMVFQPGARGIYSDWLVQPEASLRLTATVRG